MGKWRDRAMTVTTDASDDRNDRDNSPPNVPNVAIVTGAPSPAAPSLSRWRRELAFLQALRPDFALFAELVHSRLEPALWRRMLLDGDGFLKDWGEQAAALGWSDLDLFGCSPAFANRYDRDGLLINLGGSVVVAMTDATATIEVPQGGRHTYRRADKPGAVTWWRAFSDMGACDGL